MNKDDIANKIFDNINEIESGKTDLDDLDMFPLMKVSDTVPVTEKDLEELDVEKDAKNDYHLARSVSRNLIEQQQESIQAFAKFINQCPSPRAYEVLNQMIKTAKEIADGLVTMQKDYKEVRKPSIKESQEEGKGGNKTYIFTGGPTEILELLEKEKNTIDVTNDE